MAKVARAFPDLTIVALEPFYLLEGQLLSDLVADIAPNVMFDITSCWDFDHVAAFANRWGSSRLLYGGTGTPNGSRDGDGSPGRTHTPGLSRPHPSSPTALSMT